MRRLSFRILALSIFLAALPAFFPEPSRADLILRPEELVQANGSNIAVSGYSVPSFVFWDGDTLKDLVVGEGGGTSAQGKVRVYLNVGTASAPQFTNYFYAQSQGSDLVVPAAGCLGAFARVFDLNADNRKDLLVGLSDGTVKQYLNVNTDADPGFDGGTLLQVGEPGTKVNINVGGRATPILLDWNNDGKNDLVVGALDGKLHVYLNVGSNSAPDFRIETFAQENGAALVVPTFRSSPHVVDLDDDGKKDVLTGNTEGQLLFYRNVGADNAPSFSGYTLVEADSAQIDLPGSARSRPFVCDWNGDGLRDVLIGAGDGLVHLYLGMTEIISVPGETPPPGETGVALKTYPNPFNPDATISFALDAAQRANLYICDPAGRRVATLLNKVVAAGMYYINWNGKDDHGREVSSGVYFVHLDAGSQSSVRKMVLLR